MLSVRLRGRLRGLGRLLLAALAVLAAVAVGVASLLGAAAFTPRPALFALAGLAGFCLANLLALLAATRGVAPARRRRVRALSFALSTVSVAAVFSWTALVPLDDPRLPPAPVEGQRFWELPTGSRIAYVARLPAEGRAREAPVVFLHGGPGVPDMRGDSEYFGGLARDGFGVYVYDQVGSGRSERLADPSGYTLERAVADLEAIRKKIGAERMVLIGHSHGGVLASAYAASRPDRVEKLVLSSPGDPSPEAGGASMLGRLDTKQKLGVFGLLLPPRPMLAYALLQVNPAAAHAFAGDAEMDARFDRVYNRARPALHCRDEPPGPELHGQGFYANQYPQSAARAPHKDFLPELERQRIPTLVIKGRCDYLSWSSAQEYLGILPGSRLVYLEGAGHNAHADEPERYMESVRAFLAGEPLPARTYEQDGPPEDYEGPR